MESILEDKNETIIKLKTSNKGERPSSYQSDMIKVLNKKLAEKEERIRNLHEQLDASTWLFMILYILITIINDAKAIRQTIWLTYLQQTRSSNQAHLLLFEKS